MLQTEQIEAAAPPPPPAKEIDYRFRIMYAAAITMTVLSHCQNGAVSVLVDWMPYHTCCLALFMFGSGYFYNPKVEEKPWSYILKKVRRLLVPMYIYNVCYGFLITLLHKAGFTFGGQFTWYNVLVAPINNGHQFTLNLGGWYLAPLFMIECFNVLFRAKLRQSKQRIPEFWTFLIYAGLGMIGTWLGWGDGLSLWRLVAVRMLYFLPFFGLGVYYRRALEKWVKLLPSLSIYGAFFATKLFIALKLGHMPAYTPSWCRNFTDGPVIPLIIGFADIAFWLRTVRILEPALGKSKLINEIAGNTYSIMINHRIPCVMLNALYALFSKHFALFSDFDWESYRKSVYVYQIGGVKFSLILYPIVGIAFSLLVQKIIDGVKQVVTA